MRLIGLFFVLSLLVMPLASAISTDLQEVYQPRETVVAEITGNVLKPISAEDVEFKRGNVRVPLNYDLKILGDRYFVWFVAPLEENNYTLIINNVFTTIEGKQEEIDFEQTFNVGGNRIDYTLTPGFVLASDEGFELEAFSYVDEDLFVSVDFPDARDVVLKPGKNTFEFGLETIYGTQFLDIAFGDYVIPALITGSAETPFHAQNSYLVFEPTIVYEDLREGDRFERKLILRNSHDEEVKGIRFVYDEDLFVIDDDSKFSLSPGASKKVTLRLKETFDGEINDVIYARSGDVEVAIPVGLAPRVEGDNRETGNSGLFYCEELEGEVCADGQICSGTIENSIQGACCVGVCRVAENNDSGNRNIAGWLILILILVIGFLIYKRYRASQGKIGTSKARRILDKSKEEKKGARFPRVRDNRNVP